MWLSRRAGEVVAVEHDAAWADEVRHLVGPGADVLTVEPRPAGPGPGVRSRKPGHQGLDFTDYVDAIDRQDGLFDLIKTRATQPPDEPKKVHHTGPHAIAITLRHTFSSLSCVLCW